MYSKSNLVMIILSFLILTYFVVEYFRIKKEFELSFKVECVVKDKSCSAAASIKNYIKVFYKNKLYQVEVNEEDCNNYVIGSKILLNYNKESNLFFQKNIVSYSKNKIIILFTFFIFLVIPWKKIIRIK
ncbi:hypothetical protein GCM10011508_22500 [Flavobacterium lutivivi]|nr:hypothetical protein GCM10011508_22500 [Flavobacterium lutivivi]